MVDAARRQSLDSGPELRLVRDSASTATWQSVVDRAQQAELQGRREEARELYEVALCRLPEASTGADASNLLRWIARTHRVDADLDLALDCVEAALAIAEAHGSIGAIGHGTNLLAIIRWQQGDLDEAERLYRLARESALSAGESKLAAMTAQNLGVIANIRGDLDTALWHYQASLSAYRKLGLASDVCIVLNNLGLLLTQSERWDDAAKSYDEALRVAGVIGDHGTRMYIEVNRADWSVAQGDFTIARQSCERAMQLASLMKDAPALGEAHKAYGVVERESGDHARAEQHLAEAYAIATARQDMLLLADTTKELAELHRQQGRNRDARQNLNRAHRLFSQLRARRELADIGRRMGRLEGDFLDVVRRWGESIESNDEYTQGHCERVADIACALAAHDGMDEQSLFWFRIGALLHDVGKLVIPPEVLNKHARLTEDEWALMRSHPTAGVKMLADVEFPWDVNPIVEGHHERWDGAGYPHGLAGESIPRVARMVCIADVYDALTSERSYKKAMSHEAAIEVMRADIGRQFDPALFARFEEVAAVHGRSWTAPTRAVPRAAPLALPPALPGNVSTADELTGLPLRGAFSEAVRMALAARGTDEALSLLVVDVDHFKLVNDTYGHLSGDEVLRGLARVLRKHAPRAASVARYGGDEFVLLLPGASQSVALVIAEQLRLAAHAVPVAHGRAVAVALTVSIGVASAPGQGTSLAALFAAADAGLYEAKRRGRDAVAHLDAVSLDAAPRPSLGHFMLRVDERRRLAELLGRAAGGEPQIVTIVGEGGVGKSSLVRALGSEVRLLSGSFVAGRCADSEMRSPFWPWASVISAVRALRVVPDRSWTELSRLETTSGVTGQEWDERARLTLFDEASEFFRLATSSRPVVLLLDDMQWADAHSWDLLEYLVSRLDRERLLVCLTIRREEAGRDVQVRRTRMSRDERFHELLVTRLARTHVSDWLEQVLQGEIPAGLLDHVYGQAEGNPFYTVQLLRQLLDERDVKWGGTEWTWVARDEARVPTSVKDLFSRRLDRLSPAATSTLSAAAAIGRSIDLDLAISAGIATEDELLDAIDEGVAAHVLEPATPEADERVTFAHGLLIQLLHERVHPRRLRRLRERIAQSQAARLARPGEHVEASGPTATPVTSWTTAP